MAEKGEEPPGTHRRLRRLLAEGPEITTSTRKTMLANRGTGTAPEMAVRRALHAAGLRYRLTPVICQGDLIWCCLLGASWSRCEGIFGMDAIACTAECQRLDPSFRRLKLR